MRKKKYQILIISIVVISIVSFIYYQSVSPSFNEELEYYFDYFNVRLDFDTIDVRKNPIDIEENHHIDSWTAFNAFYTNLVKNSPVENIHYFLDKVSRNELRKIVESKDISGIIFDRKEKVIWVFWDVQAPSNDLNIPEIHLVVYYWRKIF